MKKTLLVLLGVGCLASCQKSPIDDAASNQQSVALYSVHSNSISNKASIFSEVIRVDNQHDNDINEGLYLSALSIMEMSSNATFKSALLSRTAYDDAKELKVEDLLGSGSNLTTFETNLAIYSANTGLNDIDNMADLLDLMMHPTGQYYPVAIYYNMDQTHSTDEFIIGIGDAVTEDDEIPAWHVHTDGSVEEILISEVNDIEMPIIIIANGTDDTWNEEENPEGYTTLSDHDVDAYRINFRYESNNHSEYRLVYAAVTAGEWGKEYGKTINSIHRSNINSTFTNDVPITFLHPLYGTTVGGAATCTFEHDWYATGKKTSIPGAPSWLRLKPAMKYNNEWYQRIYLDIFNGPSSVTVNSKGFITYKNL